MAQNDLTIVLDERDFKQLQNKIAGLDKVGQGQVIQGALRQGMQTIVAAGKSNLKTRNKKKTGNLSKSFALKVNRKKQKANAGFKRSTRYNLIQGGNHAHLIDRGTDKRWTRKGYYRGSVSKGHPNTGSMFWTDAVQQNGEQALNNLMDAVYNELDKIMNR